MQAAPMLSRELRTLRGHQSCVNMIKDWPTPHPLSELSWRCWYGTPANWLLRTV